MKALGGYIFGPIFRWPVERQIPWHSLHGNDNPGSGQFPDSLKVISPSAFGVHQLSEFAMETVVRRNNFDTHIMDSSCWVAIICHTVSLIHKLCL